MGKENAQAEKFYRKIKAAKCTKLNIYARASRAKLKFFMIKYANLWQSYHHLVVVALAPNWFIITPRELINYEKLLTGWQCVPVCLKRSSI